MKRFNIINMDIIPSCHFKMKNMVDGCEKEISIKINDMISILYARTREQIVNPGPQNGMIYRGRVKEISKIQCKQNENIWEIVLDCSDKFGSKIEIFTTDHILDINEFDYEYEYDDPLDLRSNIDIICKNIDDNEKITSEMIRSRYSRIG